MILLSLIVRWCRGGHSHWKGVWGCAAVMTPFLKASRRSLAYQFTVNAPLLRPRSQFFRKFLHFQPCFGQNFSSLHPIFFKIFIPKTPIFQGKSAPYTLHFETRVAHIHQKKVECPPPGVAHGRSHCKTTKYRIHTKYRSLLGKVTKNSENNITAI